MLAALQKEVAGVSKHQLVLMCQSTLMSNFSIKKTGGQTLITNKGWRADVPAYYYVTIEREEVIKSVGEDTSWPNYAMPASLQRSNFPQFPPPAGTLSTGWRDRMRQPGDVITR